MKKFKLFKMLAVLIVLITSINTAWAMYGIELRSDPWTGGFSWPSAVWTYGGEGNKYWDVYHPGGTAYWRIKIGSNDYGPYNSNVTQNVGYAGYKVSKQSTYCFNTTANAGILRIVSNQNSGGEFTPYVWVERPKVIFKYPWSDGETWTETSEGDVTDNNDGTYTYRSTYRGVDFFNAKPVNGAFKVDESTTDVQGSPTFGDRCEFKWAASGYKYTGEQNENRGVFTITKLCSITYNNEVEGVTGSLPSNQEELYGSTITLATNSGNLAKTGCVFTGWTTSSTGSGGTHYDAGQSVTITAGLTLYAEWTEASWELRGGDSGSADGTTDDAMGNWTNHKRLAKVSEGNYRLTISLLANTIYYFKLYDCDEEKWYGNNSAFVGQTSTLYMSTSEGNCRIATADAGTYTFDFNSETKNLAVTYPNGTTHPSANMVYFKKHSDWSSYGVKGYLFNSESDKLTDWTASPNLSTCTIGGVTYYYMALGTGYGTAIFFRSSNDGNQTKSLTDVGSNKGKYYNATGGYESWDWAFFSNFTVTLDEQSAPATSNNQSVQFNGTALSTSAGAVTPPTWTGYDFGGYWSNSTCDGVKVINANGSWVSDASGYTNSSKWIHTGGIATLYAQWTETEWDVTAQVSTLGTGYVTPTSATSYGQITGGAITASNNTGYHFTTWTITSGGGTFEEGATTANNTFYPTANTTLTATFEANTYTITLNDRGATAASTTSTTLKATYNSDALTASITNPVKWGSVFGGWVANSNGAGDVIINTDGELEKNIDGYTDEDGKWVRDNGDLTLYAKWTVDESKPYTLTDGTTHTSFVKVADGIYRATRTMAENNTVYLYDGTTAAGPTGGDDYEFATATGSSSLGTNSDKFKYTGKAGQTVVYKLNLNTLTLSIGHVVFYLGDKEGDSHADVTDYDGYHADLASISGTFEYRLRVNSCTEWSTLYLPFDPTEVTVWGGTSKHHLFPYYYNPSLSQLYQGYYVLRTPASIGEAYTDLAIEDFDLWLDPSTYNALPAANTPYIVQWRNNYFSTHPYISIWGSGMTPSFEQPENPDSDDIVRVCGNGSLSSENITGAYVLESDYGGGAWLRGADPSDPVSVGPFQCYILASETTTANTLVIKRRTGEDSATDLEDIYNLDRKEVIVVYTISGIRVAQYNDCSFEEAGHRMNAELSEGIYIMNAGNESVKLIIR